MHIAIYSYSYCKKMKNYQFPISAEMDALFHKLEPLIITIPPLLLHSHSLTNQPSITNKQYPVNVIIF